jgi:probable selenium-dependent hydroxylase accessory protein YqeC
MKLAAALLPLLGPGANVVAFVGGGGKTSALFRLAGALEAAGHRVLVTTTTHLRDPRLEDFRPALEVLVRPDLEAPPSEAVLPGAAPGLTVLLSREAEAPGKMKGIHPGWVPALARLWDFVLVEADGAKGLPVKAPAPHEPVLPPGPVLVVGVLGLDCLGSPMGARTVHRPEYFGALTGCAPGEAIAWEHLAALVRHRAGLFKGAAGPRALLLNKADRAQTLPGEAQLTDLPVDRVVLGSLEPLERVMVLERGRLR